MLTKYYFKKKELSYKEIIEFLRKNGFKINDDDAPDKVVHYISECNKTLPRNSKIQSKTFYAFDIWQFYQMSLDKASEKYLGQKKAELPKEWMSKLKDKFKNTRYRSRIIRYCRKDARLTYLLCEKFIGMLADCGIHPKRFYSSAYIAKNFIKSQVKVPVIDDPEIIHFMQSAFFGGRTEVMQRGYFKNAHKYDMKSAYPYALSLLKKITHAELAKKIHPSADYFFADCEIEIPKAYISPVPIFFNIWKYPNGNMRAIVDNMTWKNIIASGGRIIKVHRAVNVYCEDEYPFKKIVKKMFAQRKKSESHKYIFKMLLNAYIGKLHEKKSFIRLVPEGEEPKIMGNLDQFNRMQDDFEEIIKHSGCDCYFLGKVSSKCRNQSCVEYRKEYKGVKRPPDMYRLGENMFVNEKNLANGTNIIYASLVTSTIRNIIYERGMELGNNLIAFLTDGILTKAPMKRTGEGLGEFSKEYEGWLYLLGSGVYQTAQGTKFRGFNSNHNLIELSKKYGKKDIMKIPILERTGLGRAVGSLEKFNDFNMIKPSEKELKVNFDTNRIWATPFKNFNEALKSNIDSEPIHI